MLGVGPRNIIIKAMESSVPTRRGFSRSSVARVLNMLLWLVFCGMAGTGLLIAFRLPPGSRGGAGLASLGWTRHQWGDLHTWLSYAFLALVGIHLVLHWRWLWQVAGKKRPWPLLAGVGLGVVLIVGLLFLPVEKRGRLGRGSDDAAVKIPQRSRH